MKRTGLSDFLATLCIFLVLVTAAFFLSGASKAPAASERVNPVALAHLNSVTVLSYFAAPAGRDNTKLKDKPNLIQVQADGQNYDIYAGSGTILRDGLILSVSHLFTPDPSDGYPPGAKPAFIWLLKMGVDHPVRAVLIDKTNINPEDIMAAEDFALLRPLENLGVDGADLATALPAEGQLVIFCGTPKGTIELVRVGHVMILSGYLQKGPDNALHMGVLPRGPYYCISPGCSGDSGGGVFDVEGRLIGVMFAGRIIGNEQYILFETASAAKKWLDTVKK